jgi:hypothetical protein
VHEQETDAIEEKIMQMNDTGVVPIKQRAKNITQRKCAACEKEEEIHKQSKEQPGEKIIQKKCDGCKEEDEKEKKVQRKESADSGHDISTNVEQSLLSGGQPLDGNIRSFMEPRFGHDFSKVQVHNDSLAHQSAKDINALAYTHGHHIVFGEGQYHPGIKECNKLLAHELTHVVQQEKGGYHVGDVGVYSNMTNAGTGFLNDEGVAMTEPQGDEIGIGQDDAGVSTDAGVAPDASASVPAPDAGSNADAGTNADAGATTTPAPTTPAASCTITSTTGVHAPDRSPDNRTTIGVCETVTFSVGGAAINWSADKGWPLTRNGKNTYDWAAPEEDGTATITATNPATSQTCSIIMTVIKPESIVMRRNSILGIHPTTAATVGMTADVFVRPRNVNFGWVSVLEDPGPASNVTGYFAALQAAGTNLNHVPSLLFSRFNWNNSLCCDTAAIRSSGLPAPYSVGTWDWDIPVRYRCFNSTGTGHLFTRSLQQFRMDAAGNVSVRKAGAHVP